MDFKVENIDGVTVIFIPGKTLDASNVQGFKTNITPLIEDKKRVILNMNQMGFVDSSGCGALLSCLRKIQAGNGELRLCNVSKQVKDLLKLIRMDKIFEIYNTVEEAVKAS